MNEHAQCPKGSHTFVANLDAVRVTCRATRTSRLMRRCTATAKKGDRCPSAIWPDSDAPHCASHDVP